MEAPILTVQSTKHISFQQRHQALHLFHDSSRYNRPADRPNISRSDYAIDDRHVNDAGHCIYTTIGSMLTYYISK